MFSDSGYIDKKQKRFYRAAARTINNQCGQRFTADQIKRLFTDHPELRLDKDPAAQQLAQMILADTADDDIHEWFGSIVNEKYSEFFNSGCDRFWGNYQTPITYSDDFIPVAVMIRHGHYCKPRAAQHHCQRADGQREDVFIDEHDCKQGW